MPRDWAIDASDSRRYLVQHAGASTAVTLRGSDAMWSCSFMWFQQALRSRRFAVNTFAGDGVAADLLSMHHAAPDVERKLGLLVMRCDGQAGVVDSV